jgi:hypothetical protein
MRCNNRHPVKLLRLCLLLLLVTLLPIRGAVAAAMMCPPTAGAPHAMQASDAGHAHGTGHDHVHAADHGHAEHGEHHEAGAGTPQDKCNLCAASCFVTPLVSEPYAAPPPPMEAARVVPQPDAAAASFVAGGPERPPRSI